MKVRLKLTLDELKALVVILTCVASRDAECVDEHIYALEAENLIRKLTPKFFEVPKKHYSLTLNSIQIIALTESFFFLTIGNFERVLYNEVCQKINLQYVSEAHHRKCRAKALGGKSYITLLD